MEFIPLLKWLFGLLLALFAFFGVRNYGNLREDKGLNKGVKKATEANDESYMELADDVLNGDHPYSVSDGTIAEISGSESDSKGGMASDIQRKGGKSRPGRNGVNTSR